VHQRPGRRPGGQLPGIGTGGAVQEFRGAGPRLADLGVVPAVQLRLVHDLEVGAVGDREPHVGHAHLQEATPGIAYGAEFLGQHAISLRGDRREQPGLVPEVIRRRRVGDPGAPGDLPQAHGGRTGLPDDLHGRAQQRRPQVPVMVGAGRLRWHPPILVDI
jgi:hypothetical protein